MRACCQTGSILLLVRKSWAVLLTLDSERTSPREVWEAITPSTSRGSSAKEERAPCERRTRSAKAAGVDDQAHLSFRRLGFRTLLDRSRRRFGGCRWREIQCSAIASIPAGVSGDSPSELEAASSSASRARFLDVGIVMQKRRGGGGARRENVTRGLVRVGSGSIERCVDQIGAKDSKRESVKLVGKQLCSLGSNRSPNE